MKTKRGKGAIAMGRLSAPDFKPAPKSAPKPDRNSIEYLCDVVKKVFHGLDVRELRTKPRKGYRPLTIEVKDGMLDVFGGMWAEAGEIEIETKDLDGSHKAKVPGFVFGVVAHIRNYPHEPDDYEPVEKGQCQRAWQAAAELARLYFENELSIILENIGYEEMAEEEQEDMS